MPPDIAAALFRHWADARRVHAGDGAGWVPPITATVVAARLARERGNGATRCLLQPEPLAAGHEFIDRSRGHRIAVDCD